MGGEKLNNFNEVISLGEAEYLGKHMSYHQIQDHPDKKAKQNTKTIH